MADIKEIIQRLNDRCESVAAYLLPRGKREGQEWICGSVNGEPGHSCKVHLTGQKAGWWKDFHEGDGGDLLDLWVATRCVSLSEAITEAKQWLGIIDPARPPKRSYVKPKKPKFVKKPKPQSPVMQYLTETRKLTVETIRAYKISEGMVPYGDKQERLSVVFPYLLRIPRQEPDPDAIDPETSQYEDVLLNIGYVALEREKRAGKSPKKISRLETGAELCLFGWHLVPENCRKVLVTEGAVDCATWYQYGLLEQGIGVLSLPQGISGQTWIENEWSRLERFETIYISVDNEDVSQKQVPKLMERLGYHRCLNVTLPYKDANECLQKGVSRDEMLHCIEIAQPIDPEELRASNYYLEDVLKYFHNVRDDTEPGFVPHFESRLRFGRGEVTLVAGEEYSGKTTLVRQLMVEALVAGEMSCIATLEESVTRLLARMARQVAGERVPEDDTVKRILSWLDQTVWGFRLIEAPKIDRIMKVWEYAHKVRGVTHFVLDNLTKLAMKSDDWAAQQEMYNDIAAFARRTDGHVWLISHLTPEKDRRSGAPLMPKNADVRGNKAISFIADNVLLLRRNEEEDRKAFEEASGYKKSKARYDEDEAKKKFDALLFVNKMKNVDPDRYEKVIGLFFDRRGQIFKSEESGDPKMYLDSVPSLPVFVDKGETWERF